MFLTLLTNYIYLPSVSTSCVDAVHVVCGMYVAERYGVVWNRSWCGCAKKDRICVPLPQQGRPGGRSRRDQLEEHDLCAFANRRYSRYDPSVIDCHVKRKTQNKRLAVCSAATIGVAILSVVKRASSARFLYFSAYAFHTNTVRSAVFL